MTEDFTRIFLTSIIDMEYYLPKFSKFEVKKLFRSKDLFELFPLNFHHYLKSGLIFLSK